MENESFERLSSLQLSVCDSMHDRWYKVPEFPTTCKQPRAEGAEVSDLGQAAQ